jgi:hypothetical protein
MDIKRGRNKQERQKFDVPLQAMEALGRRFSSYSFTTSALDGGEWSASRPEKEM